jgi:hypothetical protein
MTQVSGPTRFLLPMTRIGGKRYRGLPSTNSPVNTPTYGAGSKGEPPGLGPSPAAQLASPKARIVARATRVALISDLDESADGA